MFFQTQSKQAGPTGYRHRIRQFADISRFLEAEREKYVYKKKLEELKLIKTIRIRDFSNRVY